ncbi:MAG: murein biosynthesis integral membrane protein MurJ [Gammaproteobacteria bacterium]
MTLLRGFAQVSGLTFVSRLFGLARDIAIAAVFGAGPAADAFFAAFRLPNTLRRFTAEGALTQAFVPAYSAQLQEDSAAAQKMAGEVCGALACALFLLSAAGVLCAPWIIAAAAPGISDADLTASLFRITFPYILPVSMVALFAAMLNARRRFVAGASAPVLLNVCMIAAALWLSPLFAEPVYALAYGAVVGGVAQLLWMLLFLRKNRAVPKPRLHLPPSMAVMRMLGKMLQSALAAGATQINLLINLAIASTLTAGSISWLYYADRVMELPAGLLGAALATVALPAFSRRPQEAGIMLDGILRLAVFLAAPAALGMALLAAPLAHALFAYGAFSAADAENTASALLAYSGGVLGLVLTRPVVACFFAKGDAKAPVRAALAVLAATQLMNLLFVGVLDMGHSGIALSVALGACINAASLLVVLYRRGWYAPLAGWMIFGLRLFAALLAMAAVLIIARPGEDYWQGATILDKIGALGGCVILGAAVYFLTTFATGTRLSQFRHQLFPDNR